MSTYTNPVIPGFYPDPSICRVGDDFYLVTSTFEYFPGVPVFHSRNLVDWTLIGHCLTRQSQLDLRHAKSSGGIYAPTIRHHNGTFYMVTTDTTGIGNFYVTTTNPAGPWSDPIRVDQGGIDPSLHFGSDGKVYFASNFLWWADREGVFLSEIDIATGKRLTEPRFLWGGIGGKFPEAPHLYEIDGWWYLIIAEGGTEFGHMVSIARSREPYGPYESCPHNPLLSHRGSRSGIQSTGHGDLVQDQHGRWWMVFLGVRHSSYPLVHHLGRETYLTPIEWTADGWPKIPGNGLVPFKVEADLPGDSPAPRGQPWSDSFSEPTLRPEWNFRRNPIEGSWSLEENPGFLTLRCEPARLDEPKPVSMVCRRQQHFHVTVRVDCDFLPRAEHDEAGIVLEMNENHFLSLGITRREERRVLLLRRKVRSMESETVHPLPEGERVVLGFDLEELWASAVAGKTIGPMQAIGGLETRLLSTEMAGGFTGLYIGLYATSNGHDSTRRACFRDFRYIPHKSEAEWDRDIKPVTEPPLPKK